MRNPRKVALISAICFGVLALSLRLKLSGQTAVPVAPMTAPNTEADVMRHLNLVLRWYRQWESVNVYLSRPGDEIYVQTGQFLAQQAVKLEFQSALAEAALIGKSSAKPASASAGATGAQNIFKQQQRIDQQVQNIKTKLDAVNGKIAAAPAKKREALLSQRDTLQGQLQLAAALRDNLEKLASFMTSAESASGTATEMTGKILALQRTIPAAATSANPPASKTGTKSGVPAAPVGAFSFVGSGQNEGLIGQMGQMVHLLGSLRVLSQLRDEATSLQAATVHLRAPLLAALRATLQQGQIALASAGQIGDTTVQGGSANPNTGAPPAPATASSVASQPQQTPQQKQRAMVELVQHFKQLSNATLPLSQQIVLLQQSQANLEQLRTSVEHDYLTILRTLLLRVGGILLALGLIWLFSWLWRRATFRYVHDARRRRQFLVLRRSVTGFCMAVVILLGFVSDFSSLATYAGLITAGVAVALQAVILSLAAYFFLVGRTGVKVGDRITVVSNANYSVAGDVVDIGLVRFSIMELAGSGVDVRPTGRIVVFPNSVLFQTNPLFKQIPGTEYTWREIAVPLHPEADAQLAEKELLAAVNRIYASYSPILERQHLTLDDTVAMHLETPKPFARVRFSPSGLEVVVRYPIPLRQAAEIDDRMVKEIMENLRNNPSIRLADGAVPSLRP